MVLNTDIPLVPTPFQNVPQALATIINPHHAYVLALSSGLIPDILSGLILFCVWEIFIAFSCGATSLGAIKYK